MKKVDAQRTYHGPFLKKKFTYKIIDYGISAI